MGKQKPRIEQAPIVGHFAARLRELRRSRGFTQAELAKSARVTVSYMWRLESGSAAPGIDLVQRLAAALGVPIAQLLPETAAAETVDVLRQQCHKLFDLLMKTADRETLLMVNPLLARLVESPSRRR